MCICSYSDYPLMENSLAKHMPKKRLGNVWIHLILAILIIGETLITSISTYADSDMHPGEFRMIVIGSYFMIFTLGIYATIMYSYIAYYVFAICNLLKILETIILRSMLYVKSSSLSLSIGLLLLQLLYSLYLISKKWSNIQSTIIHEIGSGIEMNSKCK